MKSLDALREAHNELRRVVPIARRQAAKQDGDLHALGRETFRIWDQMKADGATWDERMAFLTGVLKQILNRGREWKYLCHQCDDYGLILSECPGDATCGRRAAHLAHSFGTPCVCSKGRPYDAKPKDWHAEDFTAAGKTKKPNKGFTGFGR